MNALPRLALAAVCAWPPTAAAQAQPAILALRPAALVAGPRITLAEVAAPLDAAAADGAAWRDAAATDIGAAPLPGYTLRLGRAEIERLLRARGPGRQWRLQGADAVAVERRARQVGGAELALAAEQHLRAALAGQADRTELQLAATPPDVAAADGRLELRPRALTPQAALRPRVTVWLDVLADGVFQRSAAVTFDVKAYRAALVAQQPLAAGSTPDCAGLARLETDVAPLGGATLDIPCSALRGRLKRALAAGEALPSAWLDTAAVAQGDEVALQLRDGAIVLESRAVALDGGSIGQRIAVRPAGATQPVHAHIAGPGLVTLSGK